VFGVPRPDRLIRVATRPRRPRTTCAGRFLRGRRPDRNPLRRTTDRFETAVAAGLIAAFCAAAPFAAHAAAAATVASQRQTRAQQASYHQVTAVLLNDADSIGSFMIGAGTQASARWTAPDGRAVSGQVPAAVNAKAGSTELIWTDQSGQFAIPMTQSQYATRADLAAAGAVTGLALTLLFAGLGVHTALDRRRIAAWDADWRVTGPRWTSRR
jgi:hypothetical protein